MNEKTENKITTSNKIWKRLFIGILILQAIVELWLGWVLLFNFPATLEAVFGISYSRELDILGVALGLYLLLLTALIVLSIIWTHRANYAGIVIGIIVWIFLFTFGIAAFLKTGNMQSILGDSLRGWLTIFFAYMAGKQMKDQSWNKI
jgi:uncharacterized protein YacL